MDKYQSVKPQKYSQVDDVEKFLKDKKRDAVKGMALAPVGVVAAPFEGLAEAALEGKRGESITDDARRVARGTMRGLKDTARSAKASLGEYRYAKDEEESLDRALENQLKRESRRGEGYAKGGTARGWGKARGARKAKVY